MELCAAAQAGQALLARCILSLREVGRKAFIAAQNLNNCMANRTTRAFGWNRNLWTNKFEKNTSCPLISFHLYILANIAIDSRQQQRPTTAGLQKGLPAKQDTTPTVVLWINRMVTCYMETSIEKGQLPILPRSMQQSKKRPPRLFSEAGRVEQRLEKGFPITETRQFAGSKLPNVRVEHTEQLERWTHPPS